jgi:hypothetical protein
LRTPAARQTYGVLLYRLQGEGVESSFVRTWSVSFGVGAAADWRDAAQSGLRACIVLVVLERLCLTSDASWLGEHVDFLSLEAMLFRHVDGGGAGGGDDGAAPQKPPLHWAQQLRLFFAHTRRIAA